MAVSDNSRSSWVGCTGAAIRVLTGGGKQNLPFPFHFFCGSPLHTHRLFSRKEMEGFCVERRTNGETRASVRAHRKSERTGVRTTRPEAGGLRASSVRRSSKSPRAPRVNIPWYVHRFAMSCVRARCAITSQQQIHLFRMEQVYLLL